LHKIEIFNLEGKQVDLTYYKQSDHIIVESENLNEGQYFIKLYFGDHFETKKLIIKVLGS